MKHIHLIGALLISAMLCRVSIATPTPAVHLAQGQLRGTQGDSVTGYLGIPYAGPPVDTNRWRAPTAPPSWKGVREAMHFGASCPQSLAPGGIGPWSAEYVVKGEVAEDCLFLNVWTPTHPAAKPMPVLFWIHGGGFLQGSGSVAIYNGSELAKRGIVVVSVNYRLGILGFLAHPELSKESGHGASGYYGLMDLIAALHWVRDNIESFGGDPSQVTIAGQSAGAGAVHLLVAAPSAKGLFVRGIAESGSGVSRHTTLTQAEQTGEQLANEHHVRTQCKAAMRSIRP